MAMINPHVKLIEHKRNQWRKEFLPGFSAQPTRFSDGTLNLFNWHCTIPGPVGTIWASGTYKLKVKFPNKINERVSIQFCPAIFHPNVNRGGRVSMAVSCMWPGLSIKQILFAMQKLLVHPNVNAPENPLAALLFKMDFPEYERRIHSDIMENHLHEIYRYV